jgi:hypothetical protein
MTWESVGVYAMSPTIDLLADKHRQLVLENQIEQPCALLIDRIGEINSSGDVLHCGSHSRRYLA